MTIIKANELNPLTRDRIVEMFCEDLMYRIKEANAHGQRERYFDASIYCIDGKEYIPACRYDKAVYKGHELETWTHIKFENYASEVRQMFAMNGYTFKRDQYGNEDIVW